LAVSYDSPVNDFIYAVWTQTNTDRQDLKMKRWNYYRSTERSRRSLWKLAYICVLIN